MNSSKVPNPSLSWRFARTNSFVAPSPCAGSGLLIVMCILAIVSVFIAVAINNTSGTARLSARARNYVSVEKATEGAIEHGFGIWKARTVAKNAPLTTSEAKATLSAPAFPGMSYGTAAEKGPLAITAVDEYGAPAATATRIFTNLLSYPGFRGFTYRYLVSAKMRQTNTFGVGAVAGVTRRMEYTEVPLFQSMFFFEGDLAIAQPAEIIIGGLIHTNSNLYLNGSTVGSLTVGGNASYAGTYSDTTAPPLIDTWAPWRPGAKLPPVYPEGKDAQLSKVSRMEPFGDKPSSVLDTTDSNPNNDTFRELIEPPVAGFPDPPEIAQRRVYNKAGIEIEINTIDTGVLPPLPPVTVTTVTVRTKNGASLSGARKTDLKNAITKTSFWDQREGKTVTVANVDMAQVTAALNNSGVSGFNDVLYIHDTTLNLFDPNPKAVRLQNGGVLPNDPRGLTIASENPVYIQGDYNTGTTADPTVVPANASGNPTNTDSPVVPGYTQKPAAVIADAVMLLSNSWDDANASLALASRVAANTTYNTAIMSGFMPSGWTPPSGAPYGYSGGAINFPRFLETWNAKSCTYYGSMVELFESKVFTGEWDTGNIYAPPKRLWNFDTLFSSTPPPGSLDAVVITRGSWAKF